MKRNRFWILGIALLLLTQMLCGPARASLRSIEKARNAAELRDAVQTKARIDEARADCESELATQSLPISCFRALLMESKRKSEARLDSNRDWKWLIRTCQRRSREAMRLEELDEAERLPDDCKQAALLRRNDLRYQLEDRHPISLFREHVRRSDIGSDLE